MNTLNQNMVKAMEDITKELKKVTLNASSGRQRKPYRNSPWDEKTEACVISLFGKIFPALYGNKCLANGLEIFENEHTGAHSNEFKLWCEKLSVLTPQQIKGGWESLEKRVQQAAGEGKEMWPPMPAEFIGIATANWETQIHKNFDPSTLIPKIEDPVEWDKAAKKACEEMRETMGLPPSRGRSENANE
jgi:hypothetical protein